MGGRHVAIALDTVVGFRAGRYGRVRECAPRRLEPGAMRGGSRDGTLCSHSCSLSLAILRSVISSALQSPASLTSYSAARFSTPSARRNRYVPPTPFHLVLTDLAPRFRTRQMP